MDAEIRPRRRLYLGKVKKIKKESCVICFDDAYSDLMFSVDKCGHGFCFACVKKHIEVKLLDETIPNCPQHRCKSQLAIDRCGKLLTHMLSVMWKQKIREDKTPFEDRVYCPYQSFSYLMSKTELPTFHKTGLTICFQCGGHFCAHCKVPWHRSLSCIEYKKSRPDPRYDNEGLKFLAKCYSWRQCGKCQHMVGRSYGCVRITCRCGYVFCYDCGAEWDSLNHRGCNSRLQYDTDLMICVILGVVLLMGLCFFCWLSYLDQ